jgi:hypothetical protein
LRDEGTEYDIVDAVTELAQDVGWSAVDSAMLGVLRDTSQASRWYDVVACLFGTDCHKRQLPCDITYLIALLYDCLQLRPDLGTAEVDHDSVDNLVWSIVHKLKGVGYLSEYDPRTDPDVQRHTIPR